MTESSLPRLEMIFKKLDKVEEQLDKLQGKVRKNCKVSDLQNKVKLLETFIQDTRKSVKELCKWTTTTSLILNTSDVVMSDITQTE